MTLIIPVPVKHVNLKDIQKPLEDIQKEGHEVCTLASFDRFMISLLCPMN